MTASIQDRKSNVRLEARRALASISPELRIELSRRAREKLQQQPLWQSAKLILLYAPMGAELDVWPLAAAGLEAGKMIALPRFLNGLNCYGASRIENFASDLRTGQFGIREPSDHCAEVPLNRLDLALVPGVAFDQHGGRLGRGSGFYDRLLAAVLGKSCGVAFDEQIADEVPLEPHDVRVNCILTPTRWIEI